MYGTLNAALLFWTKLSGTLSDMGFITNPYDRCCMNMQIDGSQCTILWHVDDIKVSHADADVVTKTLVLINEEYGKETPLTVTRGLMHDYLGMTIDYSYQGQVRFTMFDYIANMLDALPDNMKGESATPAGAHLFQINEDDLTLLDNAEAVMFHHNTAKLLFLAKRARPDIQLAVAFLCTRVKHPDIDDYKKLGRLMKYLEATIGLPLVLAMDKTGRIRWYIDAAFAVHNDMKSHTGAVMTMGTGAAKSQSSKTTPSIKTIRALSSLKRMARSRAANEHATSTFVTSLSLIGFRPTNSTWNTVRPSRCWAITSPNLSKAVSSGSSETTS
jgi:hypothetical protein